MILAALKDAPQSVLLVGEKNGCRRMRRRPGARWEADGVQVRWEARDGGDGGAVLVAAPRAEVSRLVLRWPAAFPDETLFLGDAWERGYGDLQWRHRQPERVMPWYFLAHDPERRATAGAGVATQPGAFCFWTADDAGVSLWLDLRNGGGGARLGGRELHAATVVVAGYAEMDAFAAASRFCRALCPRPRLAPQPVCGNNNWYYAYGENFDAAAMLRDARFLAEISEVHPNRPYCVIDAGWTPGGVNPGGPWTHGDPLRFPDMAGLARDMAALDVRPGIWMRLSALRAGADGPGRLRAGPQPAPEKALDLTDKDNLEMIAADVARVRDWGYRLLKHDFSTYDCFGRLGFDMGAELTAPGWHWADQSLTNAEVILRFYQVIREHARDMIIIGCNTVGHLAAGLVEIQRAGDDTSGRCWERTRRMGINTLAFRLPQHGAFFAVDADCAAHTSKTPWGKDRQFLDLVARSGTSLFISADPARVNDVQRQAFAATMRIALDGGVSGGTAPLDWLRTTSPRQWRLGDTTMVYDWTEEAGVWPFGC
jgi:alpha-galactosidase